MRNFFLGLFVIILVIVAYETFKPQNLNTTSAVASTLASFVVGDVIH